MQEIISIFIGKYGLTRNEVVTEVEKVFSETLSRRYGCEVMAAFQHDLQLEVVAYNKAGGITLLLNAISEVQQFYVIESKGQDIPGEFLTLEHTLDFFKIGVKSGFHEGFALIILFPVFHFYLFPFVVSRDTTCLS